MSQEIEDLIRKLQPIIGKEKVSDYLNEYADSRFSPPLKKSIEREIKRLALYYDIENQITLYPIPSRSSVNGEYQIGWTHYGRYPLNSFFGLREQDFIKHIGIFGSTGSGKTTTAWRIVHWLCSKGKPFLVLDPKGSWSSIIRQFWAKEVRILKLGSKHAPFKFDPFKLQKGMDSDTLIADVVEVFCASQFLGFGAKTLLLRACYAAREKGKLNIKGVCEEFQNLETPGTKERLWYSSTLRALEAASTGVLGRTLTGTTTLISESL